jgi:hypothetical protein
MNQYTSELIAFVKTLPLDLNQDVREHHYTNPVIIVADAVLSINRQYEAFVVPRLERLERSGITSLEQLDSACTQYGIHGFATVWNYNHPERVVMLQDLVRKFLTIKQQYEASDDLEAMHRWGKEARPADWASFGVKGIGFTTYQYLRILCGANTTKPDVHIKQAFVEATGKSRSVAEIVTVIEEAAQLT